MEEIQKEAIFDGMQKGIENAGRAATGLLTGIGKGDRAKQDARGGELVRNLVTGGLALGGGTSAVVALVNYLKTLKQEEELEDESRLNDDTLYVPELGKKAAEGASVNRWLAPGLGVTGGILGAAGSYALVQAVYNHLKKKRHQEMLDQAQGEALEAANLEVEKSAAKMNFHDLVTAFPVAVPLLAALASGGVAYAALNKTFPTVNKPKSKYPKRIRQVSSSGEVSDYEGELPDYEDGDLETTKEAAAAEQDCEDAANEFLLLIVDQMAKEKRASICLVSDILNRVAKDGTYKALSELQKQGGLEAVVEATKGASDSPVGLAEKALAAAVLCKSARLAPIVRTLAAAEFQELAPHIYDYALSMGEEKLDKFAGIAPLMHISYFRPTILDKRAAVMDPGKSYEETNPLLEELAQLMRDGGMVGGRTEDALTSDASGTLAEDADGYGDEDRALGDADIQAGEGDTVDDILEMGGEASPILSPDVGIDEEDAEEANIAPAFNA